MVLLFSSSRGAGEGRGGTSRQPANVAREVSLLLLPLKPTRVVIDDSMAGRQCSIRWVGLGIWA